MVKYDPTKKDNLRKISEHRVSKFSDRELHDYLAETEINLGEVVNAINDVGAIAWKYEGQDDAAEIAIHQIVGSLLKQVPMSALTRAATLSALGFSQNAFD